MKKVVAKWEEIIEYCVTFKCPCCKKLLDSGHLENLGIDEGDIFNGKIKCPKCNKTFKLELL